MAENQNHRERWSSYIDALFLSNPRIQRTSLISQKGRRAPRTCEWIVQHPLFCSWKSSIGEVLIISGGPGTGKTMLSIFLTEYFETEGVLDPGTHFIYFFCSAQDTKLNTAPAILRGLIYEIMKAMPNMAEHLAENYRQSNQGYFTNTSFEALWGIFENILRDSALEQLYIILDGLDECEEASLEKLVANVHELFDESNSRSEARRFSLLVVTREIPDCIKLELGDFPNLRLETDAGSRLDADVSSFLDTRVSELARQKKYPLKMRDNIEQALRVGAKGSFLWVVLMIGDLKRKGVSEVEVALASLPRNLDQVYTRMLLQIPEDRRNNCAKILRWISMAVRPLTTTELRAALGIADVQALDLTAEAILKEQLEHCGHLLKISDSKVFLCHFTLKDFLQNLLQVGLEEFYFTTETHSEIANVTFAYLQNGSLADGPVIMDSLTELCANPEKMDASPFLPYAILHWPDHARIFSVPDDPFQDPSDRFYNDSLGMSWLQSYWMAVEKELPPAELTLLHVAAYLGFRPLMVKILKVLETKPENAAAINSHDSRGSTPLIYATRNGHVATARLLLQNGASPEERDLLLRTPLNFAADLDREDMVRLLLEFKAIVDAKDMLERTALQCAAYRGNEKICRLLLDSNADIDARDAAGASAMHYCAKYHPFLELMRKDCAYDLFGSQSQGTNETTDPAADNEIGELGCIFHRAV